MPTPFFVFLKTPHVVKKLTSYTDTPYARELQALVASDNKAEYRKKEQEYLHEDHNFRLTKGVVYEMKDEGEEVTVTIALQVKGSSLTWYFWAPDAMDQYSQEFRDELYKAAAQAHKKVTDGCDLYYRGSNAVHIKLMHHLEGESNHNHNHYRLKNGKHYTPEDFNEHLLALADSEIHDKFFEKGEIEILCQKFKKFYEKWTAKADDQQPSEEEQYFSSPEQQLEAEDIIELNMFGSMQEPCRINVSELARDYEKARRDIQAALKGEALHETLLKEALAVVEREYEELLAYRNIGGSRGLKSEIASSRQVKGSANPVVPSVMGMDDSLGKEVPDIPRWATNIKEAVTLAKESLIAQALLRTDAKERSKVLLKGQGATFFAHKNDESESKKPELVETDEEDKGQTLNKSQ